MQCFAGGAVDIDGPHVETAAHDDAVRHLRRQPQGARRGNDPGCFGRLDPHDAADRVQQLTAAANVERNPFARRPGFCHGGDWTRGIVHVPPVFWYDINHGLFATKIDRTSLDGKDYIAIP